MYVALPLQHQAPVGICSSSEYHQRKIVSRSTTATHLSSVISTLFAGNRHPHPSASCVSSTAYKLPPKSSYLSHSKQFNSTSKCRFFNELHTLAASLLLKPSILSNLRTLAPKYRGGGPPSLPKFSALPATQGDYFQRVSLPGGMRGAGN
jgi:hypothetical protein